MMKNTFRQYALRYVIFFVGVVFMALGIAITTKADLGTTPISALPYVASLGFATTMGGFTALINIVLIALQVALMRSKFPKIQYLQILATAMFGVLIDFWMMLVPDPSMQPYLYKLLFLAAGTLVLAFGIFVEVSADVVMMPGEGIVMVLSLVSQRDFGMLKTIFDVTLVVLAALLSLLLFQELKGVREGTLISAICVGFIVKFFFRLRGRFIARRQLRQ